MADVAVVGGGVGGMAAALRLRAAGHDVALFERNPVLGGKLAARTVDGFTFDTGPSLLTLPEVFDDLLATAGTSLAEVADPVRLDPICRYRWPDGSGFDHRAEMAAAATEVDRLAPGQGSPFEDWMAQGRRVWEISQRTFLAGPMESPADLVRRMRSPSDLWGVDPLRTLDARARSHFTDARMVQWAGRYATYSGSSPYAAPATLACIPWIEQSSGAWYLRGGLACLVDALAGVDGRTVKTSMVFKGPEGRPHTGYNYAPVGAVDPNDPDRVYVGWAQGEWQSPEEPVKAVVAGSADGGETFAAPVTLSKKDGQQQGSEHPWVAVAEDGTVHASYWSKGFGKPLPEKDPPPIPIAREQPNPIYHMRSSDQGRTWERTEIDLGNQAYYRPPVVATGPDDDVYVAWHANPEPRNWEAKTSGQDRTDLYLRASEDGGATWGPKRQVTGDPGNTSNQELPGISVSDDGRLDVAWHDNRSSPKPARGSAARGSGGSQDLQDIYYTFSEDGGKTFAPALRVNDRVIDRSIGTWSNNIFAQTAVGIASGTDGAYLAWQDTRDGTESSQAEDVYSGAVRLAGAAPEDTGGASGVPWWAAGSVGLAVGVGLAMLVAGLVARRLRRKGHLAEPG